MRKIAKLLSVVLVTAFVLTLAGCHTVEGAGEDVQRAGQRMERAAD